MSRPFFLERWPYVTAILIIAVTTLVRLWFVYSNQLDLVQDEAQYWDWSRRLELSYYSKGPLIAYIISLGTHFLGDTQLGVRIGAVAGELPDASHPFRRSGRAVPPPRGRHVDPGRGQHRPAGPGLGHPHDHGQPPAGLLAGGHVLSLPGLHQGKGRNLVRAAGRTAGRGNPGQIHDARLPGRSLSLPPGAALATAAAPGLHAQPYHCGCGGRRGWALPILLWNASNDFVGFKHVAVLAAVFGKTAPKARPSPFSAWTVFPDYILSQIGLLTPWWFVFMLVGGCRALVTAVRRPVVPEEVNVREALLLTVSFWPLWLFFLFWSFHAKIYPNWAAVSYASGLILAGMAFRTISAGPNFG